MAETQRRAAGSGHVELILAFGLSAAFVTLAVLVSPVLAAAVVLPASIAAGWWRAHSLPARAPHSLSAPVHSSHAVIRAAKVTTPSDETGVNTAA